MRTGAFVGAARQKGRPCNTEAPPRGGVLLYVVFAVAMIYDCAKYALAIRWYWYIALHSLARFSLLLSCLLYR